jgi:hypothetical protein
VLGSDTCAIVFIDTDDPAVYVPTLAVDAFTLPSLRTCRAPCIDKHSRSRLRTCVCVCVPLLGGTARALCVCAWMGGHCLAEVVAYVRPGVAGGQRFYSYVLARGGGAQ